MVYEAFAVVVRNMQRRTFNVNDLLHQLTMLKIDGNLTAFNNLVINVRSNCNGYEETLSSKFCDGWISLRNNETILWVIEAAMNLGDPALARDVATDTANILRELADGDKQKCDFTNFIRKHVERNCALENCPLHLLMTQAPGTPDKAFEARIPKLINVPRFSTRYYPGKTANDEVIKLITMAANSPDKGFVVLHAEGGAGKSSLVANLLWDKETARLLPANDIKVGVVIWANCAKWERKTDFNDDAKQLFRDHLKSIINFKIPKEKKSIISAIVSHYKKTNERVLFVFDDVFNANLLQFIRNDCPDAICFVITREISDIRKHRAGLIQENGAYHLPVLNDDEMFSMLADKFSLRQKLEDDQIRTLAKRCCNLPLIANLIAGRFSDCETLEEVQTEHNALLETNFGSISVDDEIEPEKDKVIKTVNDLFSFSIMRLNQHERFCYYAFLALQPVEAIPVEDFTVLWSMDINEAGKLCAAFEKKGLARKSSRNSINAGGGFLIHQLLHVAAIESAKCESKKGSKIDGGALLAVLMEGIPTNQDRNFEVLTVWMIIKNLLVLGGRHSLLSIIHDKIEPNWLEAIQCFESFGDKQNPLAKNGLLESAAYLYNTHPSAIAEIDQRGFRKTPLHIAVGLCDLETVKTLTEIWPDALKTGWHETPLHNAVSLIVILSYRNIADQPSDAAFSRLTEIIKYLAEKCPTAIKMANGGDGETPLHNAAEGGRPDLVDLLYTKCPDAINMENRDGQMPLALAAACGKNFDMVKFLYELDKATIKHVSKTGRTIQSFAAEGGNLEIVSFVYQEYPDAIKLADNEGRTVLSYAAERGDSVSVKSICETWQEEGYIWRTVEMYAATQCGHFETVKFVYQEYPDAIKTADNIGRSVLSYAAENGYFETVKFIYERMAEKCCPDEINKTDKYNETPFAFTVFSRNRDATKVMEYLYEKCPDAIRLKDNVVGRTPLRWLAGNNHLIDDDFPTGCILELPLYKCTLILDVVPHDRLRFLVEKYPEALNIADDRGVTPLSWAKQNRNSNDRKISELARSVLEMHSQVDDINLHNKAEKHSRTYSYGEYEQKRTKPSKKF